MYKRVKKDFLSKQLVPPNSIELATSYAIYYTTQNNIVNHRKRNYVLGGSILLVSHNKTQNVFRPSDISQELGENYSPSKVTGYAYKIGMYLNMPYQKPTSERFAKQYATELGYTNPMYNTIEEIYNDVKDTISGKSDSSVGAALVYTASQILQDPCTQQDVSNISGRSKVCIRDIYYHICSNLTVYKPEIFQHF